MCMRTVHDVVYAVIDMEDSISSAAEKADKLQRYLDDVCEDLSWNRVLRELNAVDAQLKEARSRNAFIRKSINRRDDAS